MSATQVPFALPVSVYEPKTAEGWWVLDAFNNIAVRCDTVDHAEFVSACINNHAALVEAFTELLATVRGECPSLLNEDSGASAVLIDLVEKADKALAAAKEGR